MPLFSRVYTQLLERFHSHQDISLAVLSDLSADEMSHLAGILYEQNVVNEETFQDCIRIVQDEYKSANVKTDRDLLEIQKRMQQRKGT